MVIVLGLIIPIKIIIEKYKCIYSNIIYLIYNKLYVFIFKEY